MHGQGLLEPMVCAGCGVDAPVLYPEGRDVFCERCWTTGVVDKHGDHEGVETR